MERALMLRRRRCSDWRARFFADLMLAKVELRDAGVEKDANYAVDFPLRQSFSGVPCARAWRHGHRRRSVPGLAGRHMGIRHPTVTLGRKPYGRVAASRQSLPTCSWQGAAARYTQAMMKLSRDVAGPCLAPGGSVIAIGAFDGLHRGHQALLAQVRQRAQVLGCTPIVVSFEPLPRAFFSLEPVPRLSSVREKLRGFDAAGMEQTLLLRFNQALTAMSAEDFVRRVLAQRLAAREVWVGGDFRFGHRRGGDFALLERMGHELGFTACAMPVVNLDGVRVSASRIRELLADGDFAAAAAWLGRSFVIDGKVEHGKQLGRTLGYPTANIHLQRVSPVQGIFAVRVGLGEGECSWPGVASLGVRPTVNQVSEPLLEVHLFDFDGDLYGQRMAVEFVQKLRDEEKFEGLEPLKAQMALDLRHAREALGMNPRLAEA
jgi:riboflavin kinase/FMN adenylyltransferase